MHGNERLVRAEVGTGLCGQHDGATFAGDVYQSALVKAKSSHVVWVQLHHGLGYMAKQFAHQACACHAMPLVTQAARVE